MEMTKGCTTLLTEKEAKNRGVKAVKRIGDLFRGCLKSKGYGKSIGKFFSEGAYRDGIPERLAG